MKLGWVLLLGLACACKSKEKVAAGPAVGSGSTVVTIDAAAPTGVLRFDEGADDVRRIAFGNKTPVLPAVSHDGKWLADWRYEGAEGSMAAYPIGVAFVPLDPQAGKEEALEVAPLDEVSDLDGNLAEAPPPAARTAAWKARAAVVTKRLAAFESLVAVEPGKGAPFVLETAEHEDETVTVALRKAGKRVRFLTLRPYAEGEGDDACTFRPFVPAVYEDGAKQHMYVMPSYRYKDGCGPVAPEYVVWDLAGEDPDPTAALAPDALAIRGSVVGPATKLAGDTQLDVAKSADAKTAWLSFVANDQRRASYVLAAQPDGTWRIIAMTATKAVANAAAHADAKAGKLAAPAAFTGEAGDAGLRAAFAKLVSDGMKGLPAALVAFGSAPGERTTTGDALAKGWNAGWKGKATVTSSIARLAPSGTTGWVAANVMLAKPGYQIPFHVFAVFDKARSGEWTLVHAHFSVPSP